MALLAIFDLRKAALDRLHDPNAVEIDIDNVNDEILRVMIEETIAAARREHTLAISGEEIRADLMKLLHRALEPYTNSKADYYRLRDDFGYSDPSRKKWWEYKNIR